jgi:2-phospho-L-lactate transferase/gluconeogenesis factor (CofD/UPF0052 family)
LAAHIAALEAHAGAALVDVVLVNDNLLASHPEGDLSEPVRLDWVPPRTGPEVIRRAVVDVGNAHRHDSALLAAALLSIYQQRGRSRPPLRVANTA